MFLPGINLRKSTKNSAILKALLVFGLDFGILKRLWLEAQNGSEPKKGANGKRL